MSSFIGNLQLDFGDWGKAGRIAITLGPVIWIGTEPYPGVVCTIPAGYMTDGASVPRFLWWLLPPFGDKTTFAALLHDYLLDRLQGYQPGGPLTCAETRKLCDDQFLVANLALGVAPWRARLAWLGVRAHSIRMEITGQKDRPIEAA